MDVGMDTYIQHTLTLDRLVYADCTFLDLVIITSVLFYIVLFQTHALNGCCYPKS